MVRPKRSQQIADLQQAIKDTAWEQIAEYGAPSLSLRAIARQLKITAPAIYNYYPRRDDLITALILDAFTQLGETLREASQIDSTDGAVERWAAQGFAYREWALTYPQRYLLIFGTPLSGYAAPEEKTTPAAGWSILPLIDSLQTLYIEGRLEVGDMPPLTPALQSMLSGWQEHGAPGEPEVLYLALVIWGRIHGLVLIELTHHFPAFITEPGEIYRREIATLIKQYTKGS